MPQNWPKVPLSSLCEKIRGVSYSRGEASPTPKNGYFPIIRANNIGADQLIFDDLVWVPKHRISEGQKLKTGDIVVAMSSGSKSVVGKAAQLLRPWDGSFGAFCGALRPSPEMNSRYLGLFLQTAEYRSKISELSAGSNINNLKNEHFTEILVPVPPADEQARIVKHLEDLLAGTQNIRTHLNAIPTILKRLRQSILSAACSGILTAEWRKANLGSAKNYWAEHLIKDKFNIYGGGTPSRSNSSYWGGDINWASSGDIKSDILHNTSETITKSGLDNSTSKICPKGSVLVVVRSGILKHTLPVCVSGVEMAINQDIKCFDSKDKVLNKWLALWLKAHEQKILPLNREGTTVQSVKAETLASATIQIPNSEELREIFKKVEGYKVTIEKIEAGCNAATTKAAKLFNANLAKAFRGDFS